ncbi:hypothetical protein FOZ62_021208, partial [Perkinsus olseni]
TASEEEQPAGMEPLEMDVSACDEKSLVGSLASLSGNAPTDRFTEIKIVGCGPAEVIDCAERQLKLASEAVRASPGLFGGIEEVVVEGGVMEGCPTMHDVKEPYPEEHGDMPYPGEPTYPMPGFNGTHYPEDYSAQQPMNLAFSLQGEMDQLGIRRVLERVFGPHAHMET